jgi:hypothetical protein
MDHLPDNHFTRRTDDRASQGHTPEKPAAWPLVLVAILCWCIVVSGLALMGLPFVLWLSEHHMVSP